MVHAETLLKDNAHRFLDALASALNAGLPAPDQLRAEVRKAALASKRGPESVFLNQFIIPQVSLLMQSAEGIGEAEAHQAFLCEGFQNSGLSRYCLGTPSRSTKHPFTKIVGATATEIVLKWNAEQGSPLTQACPDFAFRAPFPFRIVFEGKYFEEGSAEKAARDLATDIYQAFFYRSLPYAPPNTSGAAWDYDFACLIAYDASSNGSLLAAWSGLAEAVRKGFWEGANVYVMILRS